MINGHSFSIFLRNLILCLCLGSLVILPLVNIVETSAPGTFSMHLENHSLFEQAESDEDVLVYSFAGFLLGNLFFSKFKGTNLDFCSAFVAPVFLPPKPA